MDKNDFFVFDSQKSEETYILRKLDKGNYRFVVLRHRALDPSQVKKKDPKKSSSSKPPKPPKPPKL